MKKLLYFALLTLPIFGFSQTGKKDLIRAGFSEVNITPEKPIIMSGYGSRDKPFEGIRDSLYAQAMYLAQGEEEVLLITCDLIGHSHRQVQLLKEMIEKETGIPANKILVTAAHNHGGPVNAAYTPLEELSEGVQEYVKILYHKLVGISVESKQNLRPVKIGFERGMCKMNINRRAVFSEGEIGLGRNLDGPCDHDLDIVKFTDLNNNLVAIHLNYPCHGTATGPGNYQISGDWPGISARMMKKLLGENVVVMVTAGASANINPIYGPNDNFREVEAVAYGVASVAVELVNRCIPTRMSEIRSATVSKTYPGKKRWESGFPQESVPEGEVTINYSAFRLGNIVMAGISGELFTEIGMNVKNRSTGNTSIMTHCNGTSGYINTDASFAEGGYESRVTRIMPGFESDFETTLTELISSLY